jgi:hypothetical protein
MRRHEPELPLERAADAEEEVEEHQRADDGEEELLDGGGRQHSGDRRRGNDRDQHEHGHERPGVSRGNTAECGADGVAHSNWEVPDRRLRVGVPEDAVPRGRRESRLERLQGERGREIRERDRRQAVPDVAEPCPDVPAGGDGRDGERRDDDRRCD